MSLVEFKRQCLKERLHKYKGKEHVMSVAGRVDTVLDGIWRGWM